MEEKQIISSLQQMVLVALKPVLTMDEATIFTGLSKSYLYKLTCRKLIPYYKNKGMKGIYFKREELEAWMTQERVATQGEIEQEAIKYTVTSGMKKGGRK